MLIEDLGYRFQKNSVPGDIENATECVLLKVQQELMTMSQLTLEDPRFTSVL